MNDLIKIKDFDLFRNKPLKKIEIVPILDTLMIGYFDYNTSKDKVIYTYACDVNVTQKATGETPVARKYGDVIDPLDIIPNLQ